MSGTRNSSDPDKVREAEINEKDRRFCELRDIREVLATKHGRNLMWRLLRECRATPFPVEGELPLWETSAKIHVNVGQLDFGRFLAAEIVTANREAWLLMQTEALQRGER